jgi:hypothetical protein
MPTNDSLRSAGGPTEATSRRRLLHIAATAATTTSPGQVLDTIYVASHRTRARGLIPPSHPNLP